MWRWLLLCLPLVASAEYVHVTDVPREARSHTLASSEPGGCFVMTATGRCEDLESDEEGASTGSNESGISNRYCTDDAPVSLRWRAPQECEEGAALLGIDRFSIYRWVEEGEPGDTRPAAPRIVTLTTPPGIDSFTVSVNSPGGFGEPGYRIKRPGEAFGVWHEGASAGEGGVETQVFGTRAAGPLSFTSNFGVGIREIVESEVIVISQEGHELQVRRQSGNGPGQWRKLEVNIGDEQTVWNLRTPPSSP